MAEKRLLAKMVSKSLQEVATGTQSASRYRHVWAYYSMILGICKDICMERTRKGETYLFIWRFQAKNPTGSTRKSFR